MMKVPVSWVAVGTLLLQLTTVATCPLGCTCHKENTNCSNSSLTSVPANVTNNTTVIDISFNIISTLSNQDFVNLKHLTTIFLNNNDILQLQPYVFYKNKNLLHLYLNNNKITEINVSVFQSLKKLRYLYLQNNRIRFIQPQLFEYNPDLLMLDISGNHINNLEPNTFQNNRVLSWVNVKGNPLSLPLKWDTLNNTFLNVLDIEFCDTPKPSLSAFQKIPVLKMIEPKHKAVVSLDEFTSFQDVLGLDVNEIMYLKLKLFRGLYSLSYGLIYNMTIGDDLNVITLTGDKILCYCKYLDLWFWCNEQSLTSCPNIISLEKYTFLECNNRNNNINFPLNDSNESKTSDKNTRNKLFWSVHHTVSWKTIRNVLLYASVPGCIIVLVIGAYIIKRIKRKRSTKETDTSPAYSQLNMITSN
jgi:hypothetical protein